MKKLLKWILWLVGAVVLLAAVLLLWLTLTEFKPADVEPLSPRATVVGGQEDILPAGESLKILSWNIGYAGLGAESDFFMDGGKDSRSADKATVQRYLEGIRRTIDGEAPDLVLLQEVDISSGRTYRIDETYPLHRGNCYHALNYACPFVPVPVPPIGRVYSGLMTDTEYRIDRAERISLPCPFSWPLRIANLKRCLLVSYLPLEGSDKELVLINLHLEAYDDGEGKLAQTRQLAEFIQSEYEKGNYVVAGGDFNQVFPGSLEVYPNTHEENWAVGVLEQSALPEGFSYVYDLSTPTCRLLNQPYDPADTVNTQYYVIDGFILSPNVTLESVETLDLGFANSDHNPVEISVILN